eukprot:gene8959-9913_t
MRRSTYPGSAGEMLQPAHFNGAKNWRQAQQQSSAASDAKSPGLQDEGECCNDNTTSKKLSCPSASTPRKQLLSHLISEFDKCTQQSDDAITIKAELEEVDGKVEEVKRMVEDLEFERKLMDDRVKVIAKHIQDVRSNHFHLRDEVSKEFRKTYKRIGVVDREVDLIKFSTTYGEQKPSMGVWHIKQQVTQLSGASIDEQYDGNNFKTDNFKIEDTTFPL